MGVRVLADTSFLMVPGSFKIDIFQELARVLETKFELVIPQPVVEELKRISVRGSPRERVSAKVALDLIRGIKVIPEQGHADDVIVRIAKRENMVVATTDSALRRRLRKLGVPTIFLRERSHLTLDGSWRV